jgi:hypothetical protein
MHDTPNPEGMALSNVYVTPSGLGKTLISSIKISSLRDYMMNWYPNNFKLMCKNG